ncbi:MAG: NAD(P)H-binding protein, partial [Leucobacter sp.]
MTTSTLPSPLSLTAHTLAVIGASRGTGALTAHLAGSAGATVRAVSRSPGARGAGLTAVLGDATDPDTLSRAIAGCDTVIIMVGAPGRDRSG